jgi:thioredoxin reductase
MKEREIYALLERKLGAFEGFLSATKSLENVYDFKNNGNGVVSAIEERSKYMRIIGRIDTHMESILKKDPSFALKLSDEARNRLARLTAAIGYIAKEAGRIGVRYEDILKLRHREIKDEITRMKQAVGDMRTRSKKAYNTGKSKFLDMKL